MLSENLIRQKIVTAIVDQMKLISSDTGFYSQAGSNVFEWLQGTITDTQYQSIVVKDISDTVVDMQSLKHTLSINIDIEVKDSTNATWILREVSSDIMKSMSVIEEELNYPCKYLGDEISVEYTDDTYARSTLSFEIVYQTNRWEQ